MIEIVFGVFVGILDNNTVLRYCHGDFLDLWQMDGDYGWDQLQGWSAQGFCIVRSSGKKNSKIPDCTRNKTEKNNKLTGPAKYVSVSFCFRVECGQPFPGDRQKKTIPRKKNRKNEEHGELNCCGSRDEQVQLPKSLWVKIRYSQSQFGLYDPRNLAGELFTLASRDPVEGILPEAGRLYVGRGRLCRRVFYLEASRSVNAPHRFSPPPRWLGRYVCRFRPKNRGVGAKAL
jgi:hypothetical protein